MAKNSRWLSPVWYIGDIIIFSCSFSPRKQSPFLLSISYENPALVIIRLQSLGHDEGIFSTPYFPLETSIQHLQWRP